MKRRDVWDALWTRWVQVLRDDDAEAEKMRARINALWRARDEAGATAWAREVCPWLQTAPRAHAAPPLITTPEDRPRWVPPPSPAHAAVAERIVSGDRPPPENR